MSPSLATLAEIEEAIARDEARLAEHRQHLAMLNERRRIMEAAEGPGGPAGWGWRRP